MEQRKTILITGAGGFVGKAAVEKALAEGYYVVAVLRDKGEGKNKVPSEFKELMHKSKAHRRLCIAYADLVDKSAVDALFAAYPVDQVIHTAAAVRIADNPDAISEAYNANVRATENIAQAAEACAAAHDKVIQFHCVSSIAALQHEQNAIKPTPGLSAEEYGKQKALSTAYFKENALMLPHLDVSITYPLLLIDEKPSKTLASTLLRKSFEKSNGKQFDMRQFYQEVHLDRNAARPLQMTQLKHYLGAVFASLTLEPKAQRVEEYSVAPDYQITVGELVELCDQVINRGRQHRIRPFHGWSQMGQPFRLDFAARELPAVPDVATKEISLQDTLERQYSLLRQERDRQLA